MHAEVAAKHDLAMKGEIAIREERGMTERELKSLAAALPEPARLLSTRPCFVSCAKQQHDARSRREEGSQPSTAHSACRLRMRLRARCKRCKRSWKSWP
eukprot:scaffold1964_cov252-Isochrysis_galbana.AAC.5